MTKSWSPKRFKASPFIARNQRLAANNISVRTKGTMLRRYGELHDAVAISRISPAKAKTLRPPIDDEERHAAG